MNWIETNYLPGLSKLASTLNFNSDNMHQRNECYLKNKETIMNWIVTAQIELLSGCNTDIGTIGFSIHEILALTALEIFPSPVDNLLIPVVHNHLYVYIFS